jgi:hypothetical protein
MLFAAVLELSRQTGLLKSERLLHISKRMLHYGAGRRFGYFDQIIQAARRRIWQNSVPSRPHGNAEADPLALHLFWLLNPLISSIGINHGLLAVQQISRRRQVMHISGRSFH